MKSIRETSSIKGNAHVTLVKYKDLHNVSHYHSDHELIYIEEGRAEVTVNDGVFPIEAGEAVFVRGRSIHNVRSESGAVTSVLKADEEFFGNLFTGKHTASPLLKETKGVSELLAEIAEELKNGGEYGAVMADGAAARLFVKMMRSEKTEPTETAAGHKMSSEEIYRVVSRRVLTEYASITFDEAARSVHFSRPYFSKVFHSIFGMTFTHYLNTVRVAAAIEKLQNGERAVTEIAASCGFNTIRSFNRVFKELTGYSPKSLPNNYVFLYNFHDTSGIDPTLNCTEVLE